MHKRIFVLPNDIVNYKMDSDIILQIFSLNFSVYFNKLHRYYVYSYFTLKFSIFCHIDQKMCNICKSYTPVRPKLPTLKDPLIATTMKDTEMK